MTYTIYETDKYDMKFFVADFFDLKKAQEFMVQELLGTEDKELNSYYVIEDSEGNRH